jgi:hypothetical protein
MGPDSGLICSSFGTASTKKCVDGPTWTVLVRKFVGSSHMQY